MSSSKVLLVGRDLNAIARIEGAGADVTSISPSGLDAALLGERWALVIVDLDAGGEDLVARLASLRAGGLEDVRVVGYFSHVAAELGEAAERAGIDVRPRGRFWRSLGSLLEDAPAAE